MTSPRKAQDPTRSGGKPRVVKRPAPGKGYPPKVRERALALVASEGVAAAHRATKVPKPTLTRWAKAAGVEVTKGDVARTRAATEAVRARAAEVKLSTVQLLEEHIAQAGQFLVEVAGANALAAQRIVDAGPDGVRIEVGAFGPYAVLTDPAASEAQKVAVALASLPLAVRDAEGLVTRAIHDLQLLQGEATERGDVVVHFAVPRPTPRTVEGEVLVVDVTED